MSRVARVEDTATIRLSSYDSVDKSYYSISNAGNAYGNTTSSYCAVNLTRGASAYTYVYFKFNTSSIPSDAEIVSVACTTRVAISNQTAANVASKGAKVCSGTTEKTAAVSVTTTVSNRTFTMGTWTREELNDVRIKYYATRGTSNTTSNYNLRVYVGTLTVNYAVYETYYDVSCSSNSSSISFSGDGEHSSGDNVTVTITGDLTDAVVTDNGVDVTSSLSGSGTTHTYTISGIAADHTIVVTVPSTGQEIFVKQNGSWNSVDTIFIKQNGVWKKAETLYIKENGVWKHNADGELESYVQDGLVMHLDGINKGGVSGQWTSLVGSTYFTFTSHSSQEDNAVLMDGAGYLTATNPYTTTYTNGTVEVCAEVFSTGSGAILYGPSNRIVFIIAGSGYTFGIASSDNQWNVTKQSLFSASANSTSFMLNGTVQGTKGSNNWTAQSSGLTLGGRITGSNYYYCNARIYSIRVYNRQLTEAEMLQNQKVDNARFGLNLNI